MSQVGRISGPLLKANLERKGVDLAFETNLLYLDVQCRKIGVGKKVVCTPTSPDLDVLDTGIKSTDLITDLNTEINGISFNKDTGTITSSNNDEFVFEAPLGINVPKLATDDLVFSNTTISTTNTNSSIDITPTGRVNFGATTNVAGNVFIDGNALYFSYTIQDPLPQTEVESLTQDLRPANNNTGSIGNEDYSWDQGYFREAISTSIVIPSIPANFIVPMVNPGNILYVSLLGSDTNFGTIQTSPFRTVAKALSVATAGTTVFITSGTYQEVFPLTVPAGVSVIGQSLRSVIIQPTAGTIDKDAFLLNGETTIEELTVSNFRFNEINNTGYAFRFANDFLVTSKSPYIRNVSVITKGSNITVSDPLSYNTHDAGKGAYVDGSVADSLSNQASMLFYGVTFITPGVDAITMTNGVRVESIDTFTYYANRGYYATQGSLGFSRFDANAPASITVGPAPTGLSYTINSVSLPKAFYSQALVDSLIGQTAVIDIYPNPPLYYTVVSIETDPDIPSLWRMTVDTTFNLTGQLKSVSFYPDIVTTQIVTNDIWDTTGSSVGEKWVAYYKTNLPAWFATTVGANWSIDVAGTIYIVDYVIEDPVNPTMWRIYVTTSLVGGVGIPIFTSPGGIVKGYGAELRCISCANVYGKYGIVGDGVDVLAYLIGHNFAYIGTEKDSSNDITLRVQANETVEINSAKIRYNSTDQGGDYRIGDAFLINFKKGTTSFSTSNFDLSGVSQITISSELGQTILASYKVETNNFRFSGSTVETISGNINFETATGIFELENNVEIAKNLAVSGNVDFKGTIVVGNQTSDTVTIGVDLSQNIIPDSGDLYSLGSNSKRWIESWINRVDLPTVTVDNNIITALGTNLNLLGNGTAGVVVDGLTFTDNALSSATGVNIKLKPFGSNIVYIDSTESLRLPSGTNAQRPIMNTGEIRYDNVANVFTAQKSFKSALGGVYSTDRNTRVLAHPTNNTLLFTVNNSTITTVGSTGIASNQVVVDNFTIEGTTISVSGVNNIQVSNTGNSSVYFNNIKFDGDNIINTTNNAVVLPGSLTRHVSLLNTTAVLVAVNTMAAPDSMEVGTIRFNPITQVMEVWDGDSFDNFGGVGGNATEDDVEQLTNLWTLILG